MPVESATFRQLWNADERKRKTPPPPFSRDQRCRESAAFGTAMKVAAVAGFTAIIGSGLLEVVRKSERSCTFVAALALAGAAIAARATAAASALRQSAMRMRRVVIVMASRTWPEHAADEGEPRHHPLPGPSRPVAGR